MALVPSSSRSDSAAVDSVTAGDASIVVGGTATLVTITTGRLDQVASLHAPTAAVPLNAQKITGVGAASAATDAATLAATLDQFAAPAANVAFNAKRITGLANGSAATDALAVGQVLAANVIPVADLVAGQAGQVLGGTGPGYVSTAPYQFFDSIVGVGGLTAITIPAAGNVPSGYASLRIVILGRGDTGSLPAVQITLNGDTGANYDQEAVFATAATPGAAETIGQAFVNVNIPGATDLANTPGMSAIVIPNYSGATFHKAGYITWSYKLANTSGNLASLARAFWWRNTAAITTVTLTMGSGKFAQGSRVTAWVE